MSETRIFLLCDDSHPNLYVGRVSRTRDEVDKKMWSLEIGETLAGAGNIYVMREK